MTRQLISSGGPWESVIGYSRAVREGNHVFVSGTTAANPDGTIAGGNDPYLQARRCFEIIQTALMEAGGSLDDVVRTRVYLTDPRYAADIATAGNMYAYRVAFFRNLAGYDVRLWGLPPPLWMQLGPVAKMVQSRFVAGKEKSKAFLGAKIVVNNMHPAEIWGANVRMFEVCGAGAFQLVDWRPGLAQLFEPDREIVTFRDVTELKHKIDYYLPRQEERQAIGAAARQRALRDHTYERRLTLLLDTVAGVSEGFAEPRFDHLQG